MIARVAATNNIGTSDYIQVTGVPVETAPSQPFGLVNGVGTTNSQIQVNWASLSSGLETGGSPIISYRLDWDNGTGMMIWTPLVGLQSPYLGLTWT